MLPRHHILFGLLISTILYPLLGAGAFIVLIASILIDFDHYLLYFHLKKDLSLKRGYDYLIDYGKNKITSKKPVLCIFHTMEFFAVLAIASFFNRIAFLIFLGSSIHLFLDMISIGHKVKSPSIILHMKKRK